MTFEAKHLPDIEHKVARIVSRQAMLFQGELLRKWPVDTGFSRRAWMLKRVTDLKYTMTNDVTYSPIVWLAQRPSVVKPDNITWWHSKGGQVLLDKTQRMLNKEVAHALS